MTQGSCEFRMFTAILSPLSRTVCCNGSALPGLVATTHEYQHNVAPLACCAVFASNLECIIRASLASCSDRYRFAVHHSYTRLVPVSRAGLMLTTSSIHCHLEELCGQCDLQQRLCFRLVNTSVHTQLCTSSATCVLFGP